MRVLVACEFSGTVRRAFRALGHDAWSCDLLPAEDDSPYHFQDDALDIAYGCKHWDLMIAHPPCTYLTVSANRWQHDHWVKRKNGGRWHDGSRHRAERAEALKFVKALWSSPIPRIAIENPVGVLATRWRPATQYVQPWQFGHGEVKKTGLWLKNLPKLTPTNIVEGREPKVHRMPPGPDRWKERSRTYQGIAEAMASQWGAVDYVTAWANTPERKALLDAEMARLTNVD